MSTSKKAYLAAFSSLLLLATNSYAGALPGPIVETEWLADNLDKVQILDVRTNPKTFRKKAKKAAVNPCGAGGAAAKTPVGGHIETDQKKIALVKWKKVHTKAKGTTGIKLNVMNLEKDDFAKLMKKSGVSNATAVVITNNAESPEDVMLATRLYWTMKYYGHPDVAILNGGTYKWISEKRDISTDKSKAKGGKYEVTAGNPAILASMGEVTKATQGEAQLIDSRPVSNYLGLADKDKFVVRPGHIPTAKNWAIDTNLKIADSITFQTADNVKAAAAAQKIDTSKPTITYSDTGGLASLSWFVLHEVVGNKGAKLYDGSLNEWTQIPDAPLVTMEME